jgi:membrane protease YdiL (CAAX protease family)
MLFSAGHLYAGWVGVGFSAIVGLYFAVVFLRLRNLHTIAIAHGLYNFTVFCITLALGPLMPESF